MNLRDAHVKLLSFSEAIFPFVNEDIDEAIGTILESLDKLRWRDVNKELPEPFVGVLSDSGDRVYITFDGVWIYDYWDRRDDGMEAVVAAWLPIPEWEGD